MNKEGDELGNVLQPGDIGQKANVSEESGFSLDFSPPPLSPFLFPGHGHLEKNPNSFRGKVYNTTGIISIGFIGLTYLNYTQKANEYKSTDVLPFYLVSLNSGILPGLLYSESSLASKRSEYESSIPMFNSSIGLFGILYLVSLLDYSMTSDFSVAEGWKVRGMEVGRWNFQTERMYIPTPGLQKGEERVQIQYKLNWEF